MIARHPEFKVDGDAETISFDGRELRQGRTGEISGLMELQDNNPVVCAETVGVPDAAMTLVLAALGPIHQSGLINGEPVISCTDAPGDCAAEFLETIEWREPLTVHADDEDGPTIGVRALVPIAEMDDHRDLDFLYEGCYGGAFYIRLTEGELADEDILGKPWMSLSLGITPGDDGSLLTIRALADRKGKCGAAQAVHAMNIMCGFEEHLGIGDQLPS